MLSALYVDRVITFSAALNLKSYFVVLADLVNKTGCVYEDVVTAFFLDKSEAFGLVEEFYCSCFHKN